MAGCVIGLIPPCYEGRKLGSARHTDRVSTDIGEKWMENSRAPSLDDAGQVLAFGSRHPINGRDEAHDENLYVYRLRWHVSNQLSWVPSAAP